MSDEFQSVSQLTRGTRGLQQAALKTMLMQEK